MNLYSALEFANQDIELPAMIAFVGSGGKTTAMFQLARQFLSRQNEGVIVTTTTHLSESELRFADKVLVASPGEDLNSLLSKIPKCLVLVSGSVTADHKLGGLSPEQMKQIWELAQEKKIPILLEADGSRGRPIKAPTEYEPVIPEFVSHVIVTAGLSGLGKYIDDKFIHRPEIFMKLADLTPEDAITPKSVAKVLSHPLGGLKGIPERAKRILLLNQADQLLAFKEACEITYSSLSFYDRIIIANLGVDSEGVKAVYKPTAGIILAAGAASRFGKSKQLENWKGQSILEHVIQKALAGGLAPVKVILGYDFENIKRRLESMDEFRQAKFTIIENKSWSQGQSSSIYSGIENLPENVGSAIFLLADQPMISTKILKVLQDVRAFNRSWVVSPKFHGQRVNPVLFGKELFSNLMHLQGDIGGRFLLKEPIPYPVSWIPWDDPGLKFDIDTLDDYHAMSEMDSG